ncbi:MAG TPA: hypothetical protein VJZ32_07540 [Candidatus Bathyarchaeia archaeon]|nr:hypothetical protein [Candidatus Bathyarchaeia archaeon]HKM79207.1 hypothetical protein [Candidatus Bathyarchaeia archaeon]
MTDDWIGCVWPAVRRTALVRDLKSERNEKNRTTMARRPRSGSIIPMKIETVVAAAAASVCACL